MFRQYKSISNAHGKEFVFDEEFIRGIIHKSHKELGVRGVKNIINQMFRQNLYKAIEENQDKISLNDDSTFDNEELMNASEKFSTKPTEDITNEDKEKIVKRIREETKEKDISAEPESEPESETKTETEQNNQDNPDCKKEGNTEEKETSENKGKDNTNAST